MRSSQFELMRIIAMVFIVFYHLFLDTTEHLWNEILIYKGIQIPIHFGVLLFVMISGFWGIKPTCRGGGKLLIMVAVYFIPLALLFNVKNVDIVGVAKDFLIVSYSRYWFFRDYLFLFLFSPIINLFLKDVSLGQRLYLISILAYMAIWVGTSRGCIALLEGKNLTNFLLLYVVGNTLKVYSEKWKLIPYWILICLLLVINAVVLLLYMLNHDNLLGTLIWALSFPYCSPLLYINAILVFMIIGKLRFKSRFVNWMGASVFAVYLIHYHPIVLEIIIKPIANYIQTLCGNMPEGVIPMYFLFAIVIFWTCIIIDKCFQPLWNFIGNKCVIVDQKIYERSK